MTTYLLIDSFNGRVASRHRSLAAVHKAQRLWDRAFTGGSYCPTEPAIAAGGETLRTSYGHRVKDAAPLSDDDAAVWGAL